MTTEVATLTSEQQLTLNLARNLWSRLDLAIPEEQANGLVDTLVATLMKPKEGQTTTEAQIQAFLVVAGAHKLNPWLKEIHAFVDSRSGGIVPVVGIDGWINIIQSHPEFDGMEIDYGDVGGEKAVTCSIWRKDRSRPTVITEFMSECKGTSPAWAKTPRRMLRHRAIMQCGRVAFGISGITAPDEAEGFATPIGGPAQEIDADGNERDLMPTSRTPSPPPAAHVPSDRNFDAVDVQVREVKPTPAAAPKQAPKPAPTPPAPPAQATQAAAPAVDPDLPWSDDPPPADRDAGARPITPPAATTGSNDPNRPATDGEKAHLVNRAQAAKILLADVLVELNLDKNCERMTKAQFEMVKAELIART